MTDDGVLLKFVPPLTEGERADLAQLIRARGVTDFELIDHDGETHLRFDPREARRLVALQAPIVPPNGLDDESENVA
jgi:hypothetical protein